MIESNEPPALRVLDCQCHNELCKAMGEDDCEFVEIGFVQGMFSQILDLWPSKIRKKKPLKDEHSTLGCIAERTGVK